MNKKWQAVAVFTVIMLMFPVLTIFGQTSAAMRAYDGKSNTNLSTAGLFVEDRDRFLSTTSLGSLNKNLFFLNFITPSYLGGPSNVFDDNEVFNYYFDAGAGHFFGSWWTGLAFRFGSSTNKDKTNSTTETAVLDANGLQIGTSSTTRDGASGSYEHIKDQVGITAIFGNKTWAVKNNFDLRRDRNEGYGNVLLSASLIPNLNLASLNNVGSVISIPGVTPAPANNNEVTTTDTSGRITTISNTYSEGVAYTGTNTWYNTIEGGVVLGNLVSSIASISPWVKLAVKFGMDQNGSVKDLSHDYSLSDNANIGVYEKASITYDYAAARFDIVPKLSLGITLPLDETFSFSPDLSWEPQINIYANKYTAAGGGEETAKGTVIYQTGSQWKYNGLADDGGRKETTTTYNSEAVSEISSFVQTLAAGLKLAAKFDRIGLALKWGPSFATDSRTTTTKTSTRTVVKTLNGANPYNNKTVTTAVSREDDVTEKSIITFKNEFRIGGQVWLKPDKFRLNAGALVTARTITTTTENTTGTGSVQTVTTAYDDGHIDAASKAPVVTTTPAAGPSKTYTQTYDSNTDFSGSYHLGCTYFFTDNLNLDFYLSNSAADGVAENNWGQLLMPSTWALQINIRY
jgi:hypothetical protein